MVRLESQWMSSFVESSSMEAERPTSQIRCQDPFAARETEPTLCDGSLTTTGDCFTRRSLVLPCLDVQDGQCLYYTTVTSHPQPCQTDRLVLYSICEQSIICQSSQRKLKAVPPTGSVKLRLVTPARTSRTSILLLFQHLTILLRPPSCHLSPPS